MTNELELEDIQQHSKWKFKHSLNQIICKLQDDWKKNGEFWKEKVEVQIQTFDDRLTALE